MIRNADVLLVSKAREAHLPAPVGPGAACGYGLDRRPTLRATFAQAHVFIKPVWCQSPSCFNGKDPSS